MSYDFFSLHSSIMTRLKTEVMDSTVGSMDDL